MELYLVFPSRGRLSFSICPPLYFIKSQNFINHKAQIKSTLIWGAFLLLYIKIDIIMILSIQLRKLHENILKAF